MEFGLYTARRYSAASGRADVLLTVPYVCPTVHVRDDESTVTKDSIDRVLRNSVTHTTLLAVKGSNNKKNKQNKEKESSK